MKHKYKYLLCVGVLLFFSVFRLSAQVPYNVPVNGLVAWYPFNGNANDQSGNHYDGKMYFTQFTQDRNGTSNAAVLFNGVNAYINSNIGALQTRQLTLSTWLQTWSAPDLQGLLVARNPIQGATGLYLLQGNDYIQQLSDCNNEEKLAWRDTLAIPGKWVHFAATFDGEVWRNYVNGRLVAEDTFQLDLCIVDSFEMGRDAGQVKSYFNGSLDDIGIWNRALTEAEIRNLWMPSPPPPPAAPCLPDYVPSKGLLAFWPFCGNANDESGNGNDGTVSGAQPDKDRFGNDNNAYSFDGISQLIEVAHQDKFNALPLTISLWTKSKGDDKGGVFIKKYCCSSWDGWSLGIVDPSVTAGEPRLEFAYYIFPCGGVYQSYCNSVPFISDNQIYDDNWHQYIFVVDSTEGKIYKDGKLFHQQGWHFNGIPNGVPASVTNNLPIQIGGHIESNTYYKGLIDDIGMWNRALTEQEILDLYYGDNAAYCSGTNILNQQKSYGTLKDIDGNVYPTIKIGSQEWMAQNLRAGRYNDGVPVKRVLDSANWINPTSGLWTVYGQDTTLLCPYGGLYNGYVATDSRNICPTDWHIPTDQEWALLVNTLGGPFNAAGKLKVPGTDYWSAPNTGASNASGFSALPGGLVFDDGTFEYLGQDALFWTSTPASSQQVYYRGLRQSVSNQVIRDSESREHGFSIRCVKDRCFTKSTLTRDVCANDFPYTIDGYVFAGPGTLIDTIGGVDCDTIRTIVIHEIPLETTTVSWQVCANDFPIQLFGHVFTGPGTLIDTIAGTGCDTIRTINIHEIPLDSVTVSFAVCANAFPFTVSGHVFNGAGVVIDTVNGPVCDTIRTIVVTSLPSDNASALTVTTLPVTNITFTNALGGGSVSGNGCAPVTQKGVIWSTLPDPTVALMSKTAQGAGPGSFTSVIQPLQPNTLYYVRAYALNNAGVVYGNTVTFTTPATPGPELTLYMDTTSVSRGAEVVVPVRARNLQQLISAQFTLKFDPAVLTFLGMEQPGLDSLGQGSFGFGQVNAGIIAFAWSQPNLQPISRPDGHTIFALRFRVAGAGGSFSAIRFDTDPVVIEFVNGSFMLINPYLLYPGRVEVLQDVLLGGTLRTATGAGIRSATVRAAGASFSQQIQTPLNGDYSLPLPPGQPITVTPSKNNDTVVTNGVTTFDGLLIQRHILNQQLLGSPYKIIAGDVSQEGVLSSMDIHLINQFILGNIPAFPNNNLWAFVPHDHIFSNPLNPFPYPASRTYTSVTNVAGQDFIGMKLGDVNNSYNPGIARPDKQGTVTLSINSAEEKEASRIKVPVRVFQFENIAAMQFSVQWDANVLKYAGLEDRGGKLVLNKGTLLASKGQLNVNWIHPDATGTTLADGEVLLYLVFDVIGDAGISSVVNLFSSLTTPIEIVTGDLELLDVEVEKGTITVSASSQTTADAPVGLDIAATPNPFEEQAYIRIESDRNRILYVELLDLTGKRILSAYKEIEAGIEKWQLPFVLQPGMYILKMTDGLEGRGQLQLKLISR